MALAMEPRRPAGGAFGQFLADRRVQLRLQLPVASRMTDVVILASHEWKALEEEHRKPYEERYAQKAEEYRAAIQDYEAQGGARAATMRCLARGSKWTGKAPKRNIKQRPGPPGAPKRPPIGGAYAMFLEDVRQEVARSLLGAEDGSGSMRPTAATVVRACAEKWRDVPIEKRTRYEEEYKKRMDDYRAACDALRAQCLADQEPNAIPDGADADNIALNKADADDVASHQHMDHPADSLVIPSANSDAREAHLDTRTPHDTADDSEDDLNDDELEGSLQAFFANTDDIESYVHDPEVLDALEDELGLQQIQEPQLASANDCKTTFADADGQSESHLSQLSQGVAVALEAELGLAPRVAAEMASSPLLPPDTAGGVGAPTTRTDVSMVDSGPAINQELSKFEAAIRAAAEDAIRRIRSAHSASRTHQQSNQPLQNDIDDLTQVVPIQTAQPSLSTDLAFNALRGNPLHRSSDEDPRQQNDAINSEGSTTRESASATRMTSGVGARSHQAKTFQLGDRVKARDNGRGDAEWRMGTVTCVVPLRVTLDNWDDSYQWDEVQPIQAAFDRSNSSVRSQPLRERPPLPPCDVTAAPVSSSAEAEVFDVGADSPRPPHGLGPAEVHGNDAETDCATACGRRNDGTEGMSEVAANSPVPADVFETEGMHCVHQPESEILASAAAPSTEGAEAAICPALSSDSVEQPKAKDPATRFFAAMGSAFGGIRAHQARLQAHVAAKEQSQAKAPRRAKPVLGDCARATARTPVVAVSAARQQTGMSCITLSVGELPNASVPKSQVDSADTAARRFGEKRGQCKRPLDIVDREATRLKTHKIDPVVQKAQAAREDSADSIECRVSLPPAKRPSAPPASWTRANIPQLTAVKLACQASGTIQMTAAATACQGRSSSKAPAVYSVLVETAAEEAQATFLGGA